MAESNVWENDWGQYLGLSRNWNKPLAAGTTIVMAAMDTYGEAGLKEFLSIMVKANWYAAVISI